MLSREGWYKKMACLDEIPEHCLQDNGHTEESVEKKRLFGHAMTVVETLSVENQEIFSLFYFADASVSEIAGQTGKSKNAVKAILFKARRAIARDMKRKGLLVSP
jgi:RNA polymerase sigma factor (sigma-70 family)